MTLDEQLAIVGRGIVPKVWSEMRPLLAEKLNHDRPLRIKCGFDPTAPDLHLGHTVVMQKMAHFQQCGHEILFIIGDFTAMIGDPTGKNQTRPALKRDDVLRNAETYRKQLYKILDPDRTQVLFNSEWLGELSAEAIVRLAARYTVARLLERHDFQSRYRSGQAISVHEFLYPLLQAYDSVHLKADVELGGNDQLFNLMVGRDVMKEYGLAPQVILTTELLIGTDGHEDTGTLTGEKMSKSLGNYVGVDDPPGGEHGMYGKLMSISDPLMWHYYQLLSSISDEEMLRRRTIHPKEAKHLLAHELTARYHDEQGANDAVAEFERLHPAKGTSRGVPDDIETMALQSSEPSLFLSRAMVDCGLAKSNGEARRLIAQGGVQVDSERIHSDSHQLGAGGTYLLKVGKRRFRKITITRV